MTQQSVPPFLMLRSFLTVGSGFVTQWMILALVMFVVGSLFFPDFIAYNELDEAGQQTAMESDPWGVISPLMFWIVVGLASLGSVGVGWFVFKTAPFAQFSHAVFVAVLVLINYLQMMIADPPAKKTMTLVFMLVFPIAILIGARFARGRLVEDEAS